uniref:5'-3' exonuclease alpha-helical arch N-terminal domain-containing protein n=1 Tax=Solanum lycopersicum TaxID=4081 RepID=A0A3Q7FIF6_SOLLC
MQLMKFGFSISLGHTSLSTKQNFVAKGRDLLDDYFIPEVLLKLGDITSTSLGLTFKGLNFRHNMYPSYKSNRSPTPDTIVQGLQFLKASLKAMSIKVIEVRFVEHWVKDQSSKFWNLGC